MNRLEAIESRLARAERYNRVLSLLCVGIAGLLIVACTTLTDSQKHNDIIRTSRLQVIDPAGRVMLDLGADATGYALVVRDESGRDRVTIRHDAEESGLFVKDEAGDARAGIAHFAHGGSGVALHGPGLRGAVALYYKQRGSLSFYYEDGSMEKRLPERTPPTG